MASALRPSVQRLSRRLRQMRPAELDLNSNQISAMGVLYNNGDLLMGELAAHEKVKPPSMTRIVNGLEARGYVARQADPRDKRQCVVSITAAGREVILADRRRRETWLAQRIAELSPEEREILRQAVPILEKVNHA
nr:MarR family transcriptional regulator [Microlunatus panaciterrae]